MEAMKKQRNRMNDHKNMEGEDGLVGNPQGTDTTSEGFKKLKDMINARAQAFTPEEKRNIELNAVRYRMMSYVQNHETPDVVEPGEFIRACLKAVNVKQNAFAAYMDSNPGNIAKILNGSRKINP